MREQAAIRPDELRGVGSTFAGVRVWNDERFDYHDLVLCRRACDARDELQALHDPPFVIVRYVRFG
jgi:hypothetical protein